ncbi:MAG TPA: dihydropteroate synthase [Candidatus Dormibacteraeota bacterium]|nr:dihydropteroate synthase [Candidatus Dormibacteraeota bacterium]
MFRRKRFRLKLPSRTLLLGERTLVMGVLNLTPDSFSDGGLFAGTGSALAHALAMEQAGAGLIDIGGESTRPGSQPIALEEELRRVLPVLKQLRGKLRIPISIDTRKAQVAEAAAEAGAEIINDISGLRSDPRIAEVARKHKLSLILMHIRGEPHTMHQGPFARDVWPEVIAGLRAAVARARHAGVPRSQIILDPGIGFGKSFAQNYELLARLPDLAKLGYPLLVGTSRKTFLGATLARDGGRVPPTERLQGTAATVAASILGGAHIVRVHDVAEMAQVARVTDCVLDPRLAAKS